MTQASQYESFVAGLVQTLLRSRDASEVGHGRRNHLVGASGVRHQLDVSFFDRSVSLPKLVIIECKHLREPIKLAHVKVLKATIDDLAANRANEVTVRGDACVPSRCAAKRH